MGDSQTEESQTRHATTQKEVKRRGPTTGKYILKEDGGPYPLQWDEEDNPIGDHEDRYKTYVGAITRAHVNIFIEEWRKVDKETKEMLWTAIQKMFMIEDKKKKVVLSDCNKRWKDFKTRLTHDYFITKTKNVVEHCPWELHVGITKDDWDVFEQIRQSDKFKALSEQNQANQKMNDHPHCMGRGGYSHLDQAYIQTQIQQVLLSSNSISGNECETPTVTPKPRHQRWIDGRTNKNGQIKGSKTQLVANKIHELEEKEKSGEFVPVGSHDILTEALGTPEHGGRVRGIGGKSANVTSVFKRKKRKAIEAMIPVKQLEDYAKLVKEQAEQTLAEMEIKWEQRTLRILKSCGITPPPNVELHMRESTPDIAPKNSSVHSVDVDPDPDPDPFANSSKTQLPCELTTNDNRIVAKGLLCKHSVGDPIHGVQLQKDHYKVKILHVLDGEGSTPLPVPFFGHDLLGDNIEGSWTQWPQKQVILSNQVNQHINQHQRQKAQPKKKNAQFSKNPKKKNIEEARKVNNTGSDTQHISCEVNGVAEHFVISNSIVETLPPTCKNLYHMLQSLEHDFSFDIQLEADMYYIPGNENANTFVIGEDVKQFFNMGWLHTPIIHVWTRFLHSYCKKQGIQDAIGFLSPTKLALVKCRPTYVSNYLTKSIAQQSMKKYLLVPLHQNHRWMLIVIRMEKNEAIFFSPSQFVLQDVEIKGHLSMCFRTLGINKGSNKRSSLDWIEANCPLQSVENECGYYMMRIMYEIILGLLEDISRPIQELFSREPYLQEQINEIRDIWAKYFINTCV